MLSLLVRILCHNTLRIFSEFSFFMSQHSPNFLRIFILNEGNKVIISQNFTMVCTSYCWEFVIKSTREWWILSNRKLKGWKSWFFCNKFFAFKHDASAIWREQRLSSKTWLKISDNTKFCFSTSPLGQGDLVPAVCSLVLMGSQRRNIPSLTNFPMLWVRNLSAGL